jgi:hypothetical protein
MPLWLPHNQQLNNFITLRTKKKKKKKKEKRKEKGGARMFGYDVIA